MSECILIINESFGSSTSHLDFSFVFILFHQSRECTRTYNIIFLLLIRRSELVSELVSGTLFP